MQRPQLEHLIRAAAEITNQYEFVIIGSQSVLGAVPAPPAECTLSMEADMYPLLAHGIVSMGDAFARTAEPENAAEAARASAWIRRLHLPVG